MGWMSVRRLIRSLWGETAPSRSMTDGGVALDDSTGGETSVVSDTGADHAGRARSDKSSTASVATGSSGGLGFSEHQLLNSIGRGAFVLNAAHEIVVWNDQVATLTGTPSEEAIGHEHASEMFYPDGRRAKTLADKVLAAPTNAAQQYDIELRDPEQYLYGDTSTMTDAEGIEHHIDFTARPIFDDSEVVAVIEVIEDRTEIVQRNRATEGLVGSVSQTLQQVSNGQLGARATFTDEQDVLSEELTAVVATLNETLGQLEALTGGVESQTRELDTHIEAANEAADDIARTLADQNELLDEGVSEMQTFSASMEEVAATAEEVDSAAEEAREAAESGLEASEGAQTATDEVVEMGDALVDSVTELGDRMDDIEAVVEVISDVAEQTNLLALNANIEAARAGEEGDGFAVVAEEVKNLADETRTHTEEITDSIRQLQEQSDETVAAATESHDRIDDASTQIGEVLDAFEEIAASIDRAADGIAEVSRATDDQAATVEEMTTTLENVREHAEATDEAAERIVESTDKQGEAIDELSDQLDTLQGK